MSLPRTNNGPFAWNGILVFWLAGTAFIIWFIAMTAMLLKAIARQERAENQDCASNTAV